ncbi:hypothetical protein PHYSODRAFT_524361, partial [Phytophthora sojae]
YQILPRAAKLLFAVPTSSAHIERDFCVAGSMVTPQRTRITQHNVDMGIFLNRNRTFVDLTQCEEIPSEELASHVPSSMSYPIECVPDGFGDDVLAEMMSSTSLSELFDFNDVSS